MPSLPRRGTLGAFLSRRLPNDRAFGKAVQPVAGDEEWEAVRSILEGLALGRDTVATAPCQGPTAGMPENSQRL
jgi:hypothetical protein